MSFLRRMLAFFAIAISVGLVSYAFNARSQASDASEALLAVHTADPLDYALVVDRVGDQAVLALLQPAEGTPVDVAARLVAVRASAWLHAPEAALPVLAQLAQGTDPDLAPTAMHAALRIAERLTRQDLDMREADEGPLREALPLLEQLASDESARADLRAAAERAHTRIDALLQIEPEEALGEAQ